MPPVAWAEKVATLNAACDADSRLMDPNYYRYSPQDAEIAMSLANTMAEWVPAVTEELKFWQRMGLKSAINDMLNSPKLAKAMMYAKLTLEFEEVGRDYGSFLSY